MPKKKTVWVLTSAGYHGRVEVAYVNGVFSSLKLAEKARENLKGIELKDPVFIQEFSIFEYEINELLPTDGITRITT